MSLTNLIERCHELKTTHSVGQNNGEERGGMF